MSNEDFSIHVIFLRINLLCFLGLLVDLISLKSHVFCCFFFNDVPVPNHWSPRSLESQEMFIGLLQEMFIGLLRGEGPRGGGSLIFPKVPQSSVGILRAPPEHPPLKNPIKCLDSPELKTMRKLQAPDMFQA